MRATWQVNQEKNQEQKEGGCVLFSSSNILVVPILSTWRQFFLSCFFFLSGLTQTQDIHYSETRGSRERNREEQQKGWGDGSWEKRSRAEAWRGSRGWCSHGEGGGREGTDQGRQNQVLGGWMGREPSFLFQQMHVAIVLWKEKFSGNAAMARHLGTNCCLTCLFLLLIVSLSFWGRWSPQSKSITSLPRRQRLERRCFTKKEGPRLLLSGPRLPTLQGVCLGWRGGYGAELEGCGWGKD